MVRSATNKPCFRRRCVALEVGAAAKGMAALCAEPDKGQVRAHAARRVWKNVGKVTATEGLDLLLSRERSLARAPALP